jgi:ferritin-like metal-binding protein YciE
MKLKSLDDLFHDQVRDLYDAEKKLVKALPKMAKASYSAELKAAFQEHLEQTKGHVERLEQVFDLLDKKAKAKTCRAMVGLIEEGAELIETDADPDVLDAGLISAAQRVEHYEIAGYGCLRAWAQQLGHTEAVELLGQTLDEEKAADQKLNQIAEAMVNKAAQEAAEEEAEEEEEDEGEEEGEEEEEEEPQEA